MEPDAVVAGHVNAAAEIQRGMEHRQGFVLGHVDLVQHAEAAELRALVDGALPQRHPVVVEGVRPQQGGGVRVDVEGHIPAGTAEGGGQILRQHILTGGLRPHQQQILSAEKGCDRLLPDLSAVIEIPGHRNTAGQLLRRRVFVPEGLYLPDDPGIDPLTP